MIWRNAFGFELLMLGCDHGHDQSIR